MAEAVGLGPGPARSPLSPILTLDQTRELVGVVLPVYFKPEVPETTIRALLDRVLADSEVFCRPENLLVVVDRDTPADRILSEMPNLRVHRLPRNRAKAGAIAAGLETLLACSKAEILITRDGDTDHNPEDIPRLASRLIEVRETAGGPAGVMGARISLAKPMGWLREQWELLTNGILLEMAAFRLATMGRVMDRRFWAGVPADIQSGYRAYDREAAALCAACLDQLPDDRELLTFACEFVPFLEILTKGGCFGQVLRSTLVEQPVTSYGDVDYAATYGRLLDYLACRYDIPPAVLAAIAGNHVADCALMYSDLRGALYRFLGLLGVDPGRVRTTGFV
jgi:hypothetical protein